MGAGHAHKLHVHGHSVVHRLPAHVKIVALLGFVIVVVATPRTAYLAFAGYALLICAVIAVAQIPPLFVVRRMVIEIPFVVFAILLPFIARGEQVEVLGLTVSQDGLLAAWNIVAKGTIGVAASITLAATTEPHALVLGLQRLRVPDLLVQIMSFMVRYLDVIGDEMHRMRIARLSRGFQGRGLAQLRIVAHAAGALFIRSYERGERVHLAMLSRGYVGSLPLMGSAPASATAWATGLALPFAALVVASAYWLAL